MSIVQNYGREHGRAFHYHAPVVRMEPARKGFINGDELVNCR